MSFDSKKQQALKHITQSQQELNKARIILQNIECPTNTVDPNEPCEEFDCATSEAGFNFNGGVLSGMPCGSQVPISHPWIKADGTRADDVNNVIPLTASNGGAIDFVSEQGTTNNLLYTLPSTPGPHTVTFQWGNSLCDQPCTKTVTFECEIVTAFKDLPATSTFPPATEDTELPAPGEVITLDTGVTLECLPGATHDYATRSATNLDGTAYLDSASNIYAVPPVAGQGPIASIPLTSETVWSNLNPDVLYGVNSGTQTIWHYNYVTGASINTGIPADTIGKNEGNISGDDQCIVTNSGGQIAVYNLQAPYDLIGSISEPNPYDNHKLSQDGQCVILARSFGNTTQLYNRDMTPKPYSPANSEGGHGVSAVDCNGQQVYVEYGNPVNVINLSNGTTYPLLPQGAPQMNGTNWHVSYSPATPGYVTISAQNPTTGTGGWIALVPICPNNTEIIVLSDAYNGASNATDYPCQMKVSAGLSGNQYVFDSCDAVGGSKSYLLTCP